MNSLRFLSVLSLCFLFASLAAAAPGCSPEEGASEDEAVQARRAIGEAASKGQGSMPELKEKSSFEGELSKKEYPKAKSPEMKQTFRWDFSKKYKFVYDYEQKVKMTSSFGVGQSMNATGLLSMKAKGDKTANLVISDFNIESDITAGMKTPTVVIQGVTQDSKISGIDASQNQSIKLLFPLPAEPLAVGQSSSIPGKMPFNAYGSLLWVNGDTKLTLESYVTIDSHVCAKLNVVIDISNLDVPEELTGEYACSTKGVGILYFDIEDKCFHSGELALIMSIRAKPGETTSLPVGQMEMNMDFDNFMRFTRNRQKEKEAREK